MEKAIHFINGHYQEPINGEYLENREPGTGKVYAQVARGSEKDLEYAIKSASSISKDWAGMSIEQRSRILIRLADLIESEKEALAQMESKDAGKPIHLAREIEIPRAAANFRFFGSAIMNYGSEAHVMEGTAINYTRRKPLGIVGCISPWNLPLYLFTWKIAPALATGNCVIGKPSELTPMTAAYLGKLANEAGIPKGVLNILQGTGSEIGQAIVQHPSIKAVSFTGGTSTGRTIAATASPMFKKLSLELGGKNPVIVYADCNLQEAVDSVVNSSFRNQGQICLCGSRVYVEKEIYSDFRDMLVEKTMDLKIGDPSDEETEFAALISRQHLEKVSSYVNGAVEDGGIVLAGGSEIEREGYYFQPTIIEGLGIDCRINQEEVFGPVITLDSFSNEEEAILKANSTEYGLACIIWTNDIRKAQRTAHEVDSGVIWVNTWMLRDLRTPFGGMRNSGIGREGGNQALDFFTEAQNVCLRQ